MFKDPLPTQDPDETEDCTTSSEGTGNGCNGHGDNTQQDHLLPKQDYHGVPQTPLIVNKLENNCCNNEIYSKETITRGSDVDEESVSQRTTCMNDKQEQQQGLKDVKNASSAKLTKSHQDIYGLRQGSFKNSVNENMFSLGEDRRSLHSEILFRIFLRCDGSDPVHFNPKKVEQQSCSHGSMRENRGGCGENKCSQISPKKKPNSRKRSRLHTEHHHQQQFSSSVDEEFELCILPEAFKTFRSGVVDNSTIQYDREHDVLGLKYRRMKYCALNILSTEKLVRQNYYAFTPPLAIRIQDNNDDHSFDNHSRKSYSKESPPKNIPTPSPLVLIPPKRTSEHNFEPFGLLYNECSLGAISSWASIPQTTKHISGPGQKNGILFDSAQLRTTCTTTSTSFRQCMICKAFGHYETECEERGGTNILVVEEVAKELKQQKSFSASVPSRVAMEQVDGNSTSTVSNQEKSSNLSTTNNGISQLKTTAVPGKREKTSDGRRQSFNGLLESQQRQGGGTLSEENLDNNFSKSAQSEKAGTEIDQSHRKQESKMVIGGTATIEIEILDDFVIEQSYSATTSSTKRKRNNKKNDCYLRDHQWTTPITAMPISKTPEEPFDGISYPDESETSSLNDDHSFTSFDSMSISLTRPVSSPGKDAKLSIGELCWVKRDSGSLNTLSPVILWPATVVNVTNPRGSFDVHGRQQTTYYDVKLFAGVHTATSSTSSRIRTSEVRPFFPYHEKFGHERLLLLKNEIWHADFLKALECCCRQLGYSNYEQLREHSKDMMNPKPDQDEDKDEDKLVSGNQNAKDQHIHGTGESLWHNSEKTEIDGFDILAKHIESSSTTPRDDILANEIKSLVDDWPTLSSQSSLLPISTKLTDLKDLIGGLVGFQPLNDKIDFTNLSETMIVSKLNIGFLASINVVHKKALIRLIPGLDNYISLELFKRISAFSGNGDHVEEIHSFPLGSSVWVPLEHILYITKKPNLNQKQCFNESIELSLTGFKEDLQDVSDVTSSINDVSQCSLDDSQPVNLSGTIPLLPNINFFRSASSLKPITRHKRKR